jgi:SAM-dependent methyltransferase/uncharacterized protein YbaR (Trm112 family)
MRETTLSLLLCPSCKGELEISERLAGNGEHLYYGLLKCRCAAYPVIEGILVFAKTPRSVHASGLLTRKKPGDALIVMIEPGKFNFQLLNVIISGLEKIGLSPRTVFRPRAQQLLKAVQSETFCSLIDHLNWGGWGNYLKFRYSSPSFIAAIPLLSVIETLAAPKIEGQGTKSASEGPLAGANAQYRLLDLGCGAGHLDYKLAKFVSPERLLCADNIFVNLLLARSYFVPNAEFVFLDANSPLPFQSGTFDVILSVDTLHYVKDKTVACAEMQRVTKPNGGTIILSHLHNRLQPNPSPGMPLAPGEYEQLFEAVPQETLTSAPKAHGVSRMPYKALIPDEALLEGFLENEFNLTLSFDRKRVIHSKTFSFVLGHDEAIFRRYDDVERTLFTPPVRLWLNPVYSMRMVEEHIALERSRLLPEYNMDWKRLEKLLPRKCVFSKELLQSLGKTITEELNETTKKLMRRFVLIDAPENFASQSETKMAGGFLINAHARLSAR